MRQKLPRLVIALAALLALPLSADEAKGKPAEQPAAPASAAAMKVQIDPATGQFVSPKSDQGAARGPETLAAAENAPPMRVEKVTARAGGKKVNLQGRFRMETVATIGPDGKATPHCDQVPEPLAKTAAVEEPRHDR